MLVFLASDKGGTGRSVTSCNVAYRSALQGRAVCYLDFGFGSPTVGSIFDIPDATNGLSKEGLHSYLTGVCAYPRQIDVWAESDRPSLRRPPPGAGKLVFLAGDDGGSEFRGSVDVYERCAQLFLFLDEMFDLTLVDLSAGRSYAIEIALASTASPAFHHIPTRWLVFHRWTRQHMLAAASLVYGESGLLEWAENFGHLRYEFEGWLRFVRTAVIDSASDYQYGLRVAQIAFLRECDRQLAEMASNLRLGLSRCLGSVPLEPLLQWREQIISDSDVQNSKIANAATVTSFEQIAKGLFDDGAWGSA